MAVSICIWLWAAFGVGFFESMHLDGVLTGGAMVVAAIVMPIAAYLGLQIVYWLFGVVVSSHVDGTAEWIADVVYYYGGLGFVLGTFLYVAEWLYDGFRHN